MVTYKVPVVNLYRPRRVPGPWLARWTRLWEWHHVRSNHFEQVNLMLHRKYGSVVRIAPNRYSISCPQAVQQVYGHATRFTKDRYYRAFGHPDDSQADLFTVIDERRHATNRRKVASLYSMSSLVAYEAAVDECNTILVNKLKELAAQGQCVPIPVWMQYYAFDVMGNISVGQSFGMMDRGGDSDGILSTIHQFLTYSSVMGLFSEWHSSALRLNHLVGQNSAGENINGYAQRCIAARRDSDDRKLGSTDFIDRLLSLEKAGKLDAHDVFSTINGNIAAGSDTIGLSLSAVIYYLAQHPDARQNLCDEINERPEGRISFADTQAMPYLQAVIKETLRMHPAVGTILPRSVVGVNPWVYHRDPQVYGPDADSFRPERWLGPKEETAQLERSLFTFGAGARTCLGRNIALLELAKLIPQLYRYFEFELEGAWQTTNVFLVKPSFTCKIHLRRP
ncbi:pisatin demethylase [Aspergillus californicus]